MSNWSQALIKGALVALAAFVALFFLSFSGIYDASVGTTFGFPIVIWFIVTKQQLRDNNEKTSDEDVAPLVEEPDFDLIADYGDVLGKYTDATAVDISELPATKDALKSVIKFAIRHAEDNDMREILRVGYVQLGMFQEGVGSQPVDMTIQTDDRLSEFMKSNPDMTNVPPDMKESLDKVMHSMKNMGQGLEWQEKVNAESEMLLADINSI